MRLIMGRKLRTSWLFILAAVLVANTSAFYIQPSTTGDIARDILVKLTTASTYQKGQCARCLGNKDNSLFPSSSGLRSYFGITNKQQQPKQQAVQFEQGKTYVYNVQTLTEARTVFALTQNSNSERGTVEERNTEEPLISVQANAYITPISECEISLHLKQVRVNHDDQQQQVTSRQNEQMQLFARQLEIPIVFGYQNGVVTEVCTDHQEEESLAVNLKKSIIAALQTAPKLHTTETFKVIEPDFLGECETEYSVEKQSSDKYLITKEKALDKCDNVEEQQDIYQNWKNALLKHNTESRSKCEQTVESGKLTSIRCVSVRPIHPAVPQFSVELSSQIEMNLVDSFAATAENEAQVPEKIVRHPHRLQMTYAGHTFQSDNQQPKQYKLIDGRVALKTVLDQICEDIKRNKRVTTATAKYVEKLADTIEQCSQEDMQFIWQNLVQTKSICAGESKKIKDIFVDTAASVMNENAASIVRDELLKYVESAQAQQDKLAQKRARYLATLVSFASGATNDAVRNILPELFEKIDDPKILLSLSTLVKKTKQEMNDQQFYESLYEKILRKTINRLERQNVQEDEANIVRLFNALQNIQPRSLVNSQEVLAKISTNRNLPESIRVAAIKSLEAIVLNEQMRQTLLSIFGDRSEKNEIRIVAYRTLLHTRVTVQELNQIRRIVEQDSNEEKLADVRNYVCSHQKNLRTSDDLKKRSLLPINSPLFPEPQPFTNVLISRNFEYAYIDPKSQVGAIVEADLVMEEQTRVPKAVSFNLTVPVGQQRISIAEITIRQDNLEESLVQKIEQIKQLSKKNALNVLRQLGSFVRGQQKESFNRQRQTLEKIGKLQIFVNVDGKNVYVYDSVEQKREQLQQEFESVLAQLYKRLPVQIDETVVMMPLRHQVLLPTPSGVPVKFDLNTTLIGSLESSINGHQSGGHHLEFHIKPTFSVQCGLGLTAQLPYSSPKTVKFVHRFITAPTVHLKTELKPETRQLHMKLLMPENEQIIALFETEFNNQKDSEVVLSTLNQSLKRSIRKAMQKRQQQWYHAANKLGEQEEQCIPVLDKIFGFTICIKRFTVDDLKNVLNTKVAEKVIYRSEVKLIKTDQQMEGIEMAIGLPELFTPAVTGDEFKFMFRFDTPNSAVNRRVDTELVMRVPQQANDKLHLELNVNTPVKQFSGVVMVLNQHHQKGLKIELVTNRDRRQFLLEANAVIVVVDPTKSQVKMQLRLQPSAESTVSEIESELLINTQNQQKKKLELKLNANQQEVLNLMLVQTGSLLTHEDYKMSASAKVDLLSAKFESNVLLTKNQQLGTIHSSGDLRYNHFFAFRNRNKQDSIKYSMQYSGFNHQAKEVGDVKKVFHWKFQSTQFPHLAQELNYNIKGRLPAEFTQELSLKWGAEQENQRARFWQQSQYLSNARTRSMKHSTQVELEITPIDLHYDAQLVIDGVKQNQQQSQMYGVELKANNRKTSKSALDARFVYAATSKNPLNIEAQGEIKIDGGKQVFLYKDLIQETSPGVYQGKAEVVLPQVNNAFESMPKKIQLNYTWKKNVSGNKRIDELDQQKHFFRNLIARLINSLDTFEHELIVETGRNEQFRHIGSVQVDAENQYHFQSQLEHAQRSLYKSQANFDPARVALNAKLETEKLNHLQAQLDAQFKGEQKKFDIKVKNNQFQHQSEMVTDEQTNVYHIASKTRKDSQIVFEFGVKKQRDSLGAKVDSKIIKAEIETQNLVKTVQSLIKHKRLTNEQSIVNFSFHIPLIEVNHRTEIRVQPMPTISWTVISDTRHNDVNLLKFNVHHQPVESLIELVYKNGYVYNGKVTVLPNETYQLVADYRVEAKQFTHQTVAQWRFDRSSDNIWTPSTANRFQFRLIKLDMKNHLGSRQLLDVYYVCNEDNPQAQYAHQFTVSTRNTNIELFASRLGFDYNNQAYPPKALFTVKTKSFGGVEHKTELRRVNLQNKQLQLFSNTVQRGQVLVTIDCELTWQVNTPSHIKIKLLNGEIEMQFVPLKWLEFNGQYGDKWTHHLRGDYQQQQQKWMLKAQSINQRQNEQWTIRLEHQCRQYTTIELDTPILRGSTQFNLVGNVKKVRIDLKGNQRLAGLEHKTDAQFDRAQRKVAIKSNTVTKSGKQFAFVDAELYADLYKTSSIKVEIEPVQAKLHIQCDPTVGGELRMQMQQWNHETDIKKRSSMVTIHSETKKNGNIVAALDTEMAPRKVQFKLELPGLEVAPIVLKTKVDLDDREISAQAQHIRWNRVIKAIGKAKDLKNVHIEMAWDAQRDPTKQIMLQLRVQDREQQPDRFVASINGEIVNRPFAVKVDMPRNINTLTRVDFGQIEAEMKNRQTGQKYMAAYMHKSDNNQFQSSLVVSRNEFKLVKTSLKIDSPQKMHKAIQFKIESDFQIDALNMDFDMSRVCANQQCQFKTIAKIGAQEKKIIKLERENVANAIRGQLVIDTPRMAQQTIKFEFIKPESKLQINVYNQAGRQLDVNVDIARPLQKKLQIVSFIESIPTVDIEIAHGENSRLVIEISFQQQKKAELSINWFGQWRHDFKLEALFKCFSQPQIEMLMTSRHPAGADEIEALIKFASKEYVAKWNRKFDESRKNWTTKALAAVNGKKLIDLEVECKNKHDAQNKEIVTFKANLDGVRRATGRLDITLRKNPSPFGLVELVRCEIDNTGGQRAISFELYVGEQENTTQRTGVKLASYDQTIFGLVYHAQQQATAENKKTNMIRLELPDEIEYVLRNEVEYEQSYGQQIKSIRSELKKKQNSVEPIYQSKIYFGHDQERDLKLMRIEIKSARFQTKTPKVIEIRYNFEPKHCHNVEREHQKSYTYSSIGKANSCWQVEMLAGETDQIELKQKHEIKIAADYIQYPIGAGQHNQTMRFAIESTKHHQDYRVHKAHPINFSVIAHASPRSVGAQWTNINRHGEIKSGLVYVDKQRSASHKNMVNLYVRSENQHQPNKDFGFELHYSPQDVRHTVRMSAKWDQQALRRRIVAAELPHMQDLITHNSMRQMKSRMIRDLKEEVRHKMAYLKRSFNNELAQPIAEEIIEVQQQLQSSEKVIAREMTKAAKKMATKLDNIFNSVDVEQSLNQVWAAIVETVQEAKRQVSQQLVEQCNKSVTCRQVVDQVRDYEIEKFVQKQVIERAAKLNKKMRQAIPNDLWDSLVELTQQFNSLHQDSVYDDEQAIDEQTYNKVNNHDIRFPWLMKRSAHVLKMSQPEWSETMLKHFNKIAKQIKQQQANRVEKQQQQQQQLDWSEIRGSVHDMAVDLIDDLQDKSQQNKKQEQPFWSKYFGNKNSSENNDFSGQGSEYYAKYASPYGGQKSGQQRQRNDLKKETDNDLYGEQQPSWNDNFVFRPKQGQLHWNAASQQANKNNHQNIYWTRA